MNSQGSLFEPLADTPGAPHLPAGAVLLRGFARSLGAALVADVESITRQAPFRHMETPGGFRMSVGVTNCGSLGWVSDRRGYRYSGHDPDSDRPWPPIPASFLEVARRAAHQGGYPRFEPDACLVNQYVPGARVTPHQDKNEKDFGQPVVSVSLGLPAVFQFGGLERTERFVRVPLEHGDVVVWGGASRLRYHGVLPIKPGNHPLTGSRRINLSFRRAG